MTHKFRQPSIIARFEPASRNASLPLTIIGAHQDSANYKFPLLPAPGADDDLSGTVTILEAFRILAQRGFIPERGPVEFQWYAAEEAGLLGSMDIARYKKDTGASISAMLEFVSPPSHSFHPRLVLHAKFRSLQVNLSRMIQTDELTRSDRT